MGGTRTDSEDTDDIRQDTTARFITGVFRATTAAALDIELFLHLEKQTQETAINILNSPSDLKA
jgi:hypothetical protein